mmetsp:Transcript_126422/g.300195  ORF Transcript_126422/g.300195 Transcript_126422/m.300195 type:complete len:237 (-) Transcript_126422:645-1355(-)
MAFISSEFSRKVTMPEESPTTTSVKVSPLPSSFAPISTTLVSRYTPRLSGWMSATLPKGLAAFLTNFRSVMPSLSEAAAMSLKVTSTGRIDTPSTSLKYLLLNVALALISWLVVGSGYALYLSPSSSAIFTTEYPVSLDTMMRLPTASSFSMARTCARAKSRTSVTGLLEPLRLPLSAFSLSVPSSMPFMNSTDSPSARELSMGPSTKPGQITARSTFNSLDNSQAFFSASAFEAR